MDRARILAGSLVLAIGALLDSPACAQYVGNPWYHPFAYGAYASGGYSGGGTVAGNYMQGMSTVIRSAGEYDLYTSMAGVNYEEARSTYLDNNKKWSENYHQMREQRSAVDAQKREMAKQSREAVYAASKSAAPRTLAPDALDPVTGHITWPEILLGSEFEKPRTQVEQLFELRAKTSRAAATGLKIHAATEEMAKILRGRIEKMPANEYMSARKFIEGLDYSARAGTT